MATVFEAAGGEAGMLRLAQAWHDRAAAPDDVVGHAFSARLLRLLDARRPTSTPDARRDIRARPLHRARAGRDVRAG